MLDKTNNILELCLINLGDKVLGIKVSNVNEIIEIHEITSIPATPLFLIGSINLRGNILPVVTLNSFLNMPINSVLSSDSLIIIQEKEIRTAIHVNKVIGVVAVKKNSVHPSKEFPNEKIIFGVCELNNRSIMIISVEEMIETMKEAIRLEN